MIYINDTTRISKLDERCLQIEVLKPVKNRKTGDTSLEWQWHGYYGDLRSALVGALKRQLFATTDEELRLTDLIGRIDEAQTNILSAVAQLSKENKL